jgi:hypothetical protein
LATPFLWFLAAIRASASDWSPFLEIAPGDLAEYAGEPALDVRFLPHIGRLEQVAADLGGRCGRHLFDADYEHDARCHGRDGLQPLVDRGRAGGAGILHPGRPLEAQVRRGLQDQRSGKVLGREPGIEMPQQDFIDLTGGDAGIGQRAGRGTDDQASTDSVSSRPNRWAQPMMRRMELSFAELWSFYERLVVLGES